MTTKGSVVGERAPRGVQRAAACDIEDHVVAPAVAREVLDRIVDHAVGAELPHELDLRCAADTRDFRAVGLRDLHCVRPDPAARAGHEHAAAGLDLHTIAECLQRRHRGDADRPCVLEREPRRFQGEPARGRGRELGERPRSGSEHLVAGVQRPDVVGNRLDDAGEIPAAHLRIGATEAAHHRPRDPRPASHQAPVPGIHRRSSDSDDHVARLEDRRVDFLELLVFCCAVAPVEHRPHVLVLLLRL